MKKIKLCSCGKAFEKIPRDLDVWKEDARTFGYSWQCSDCHSTLFIKDTNLHLYDRENQKDEEE